MVTKKRKVATLMGKEERNSHRVKIWDYLSHLPRKRPAQEKERRSSCGFLHSVKEESPSPERRRNIDILSSSFT